MGRPDSEHTRDSLGLRESVRLRPSRPGPAVPRGLGAGPGPGGWHCTDCRLPDTQAAGPALPGRVPGSGPLADGTRVTRLWPSGALSHRLSVSTRWRAQPCCFWGISRCLDMQGRADSGDSGSGPAAARAGDAGPTPGSGPQGLRSQDRLRFGGFGPCRADSGPQGPGPGLVSSRA